MEPVTKNDLKELLGEFRSEFKNDLGGLQSEFKNDIAELRSELNDKFEKIDNRFEAIEYQLTGINTEIRSMKTDITELKQGALTADEKDELLSFIRPVDEFLENKTLGKDITLTRDEYDRLQAMAGFPHRFEPSIN